MDYRYLRAFISVATNLSFSRAAKELKISQSAVSRQIKLLEESLGVELFFRTSNNVHLTETGKKLLNTANAMEQTIAEIFHLQKITRIRMGALHGIVEHWLLAIIVKYLFGLDQYKLSIMVDDPTRLREGIIKGDYDLIITNQNIQCELVTSFKLFNEKLVLIGHFGIKIDLKNLENYPWIVYREDEDFLFYFSKKNSKKIIQVSSITAILNLVRIGAGIAIIPDHLLSKNEKNLNVYPVPPKNKNLFNDTNTNSIDISSIFISTPNYKKYPEDIGRLVALLKK